MNRPFLFLFLFFIFWGCDIKPTPIEGTQEIGLEAERRRPRQIREQDILLAAEQVGDQITNLAMQQMDQLLPARLQTGGVAEAMAYCRPELYPAVDSLAVDFGARVQRLTLQPRNPQNEAQMPATRRLRELESTDTPQQLSSVVQRFTQTELLYTKPILIRDAYCLRCHGQTGQELAPADLELIEAAYPDDEATGYRLGQVRGLWQITFPQREIIEYLTEKDVRAFQQRQAERRARQGQAR
jgi:hypothetical protein